MLTQWPERRHILYCILTEIDRQFFLFLLQKVRISYPNLPKLVQFRHLIPAPVDRTSFSARLYKHTWIKSHQNKPSTFNYPRSLRIRATFSCYVRDLWSHPCPRNWLAIGRAVVYFAWVAHAFSAGIKCGHCRSTAFFIHTPNFHFNYFTC